MKTVLITGGAGFIGSHISDFLIEKGYKIIIVDNLSTGKIVNLNKKAKFYQLDVNDQSIKRIFEQEKINYICHHAAQINVRYSINDPVEDAKNNILGTINILEMAKKYNVEKVLFASSGGAIYGDAPIIPTPESMEAFPISPYGVAKLSCEYYLNYYYEIFHLPYISLRYSNVYGERQDSKGEGGVISIFADKMIEGKQPLINGEGTQTRDFIYVGDIAEANFLALESKQNGAFNISSGKEISINDLFNEMKKITNFQGKEIHGPGIAGEVFKSLLSPNLAKEKLGWESKTNLTEGLEKVVKWIKEKK